LTEATDCSNRIAHSQQKAVTMTEHDEKRDQHDLVQAQIAKLLAETYKINREGFYYPMVVGSSLTLAIAAIVKIFFT
jgi:hypothetical protein